MNGEPRVRMEGITKTFRESGVTANRNISFEAYGGEIHCILGENGTGKSTLMHILSGLVQKDSGRILIDGREALIRSPRDARIRGIGMVHQRLKLIPSLTVWENIVLGSEPRRAGIFLSKKKAEAEINALASAYGIRVSPEAKIGELPLNLLQRVAVLSLLYHGASILIFDEPTLPFTEEESSQFYAVLRRLASEGKAVIVVSHRIGEVRSFADRITIMREGEVVYSLESGQTEASVLASFMVGLDGSSEGRNTRTAGPPILELEGITVRPRHSAGLTDISFAVRRGEIVAVTGIRENGLELLEDVIAGGCRADRGRMLFEGKDFDAARLRKQSIGYVPKDRMRKAVCIEATAGENLALVHNERFSSGGILTPGMIERGAAGLIHGYGVKGRIHDRLSSFSGGNIQKLILARELALGGTLSIISEPAWGLDAAGKEFVYRKLRTLRDEGKGILIFSVDIDEVLSVSDRIVILFNGTVAKILENKDLGKALIGEYMLGLRGRETC